MPQITFRGKTYNSEFEMPQDIRQAYQGSQIRKTSTRTLTDVVDMSPEVEDIYQRALRRMKQSDSTPSTSELPTTEDLYRQSAPEDMKHLPSDESVYTPSPPVIDPQNSTIEPESGLVLRGLAVGILWALFVIGMIYLITKLLW